MSELVTIARPYAKAAFEFAIEHQNVVHWQSMLEFSALVSRNERMAKLLSDSVTPEKLAKTFIAVCGAGLDVYGQNLIQIMAENGRLVVLPDVLEQFILLRAEQEETVEVDVISASKLGEEQMAKISAAMSHRLSRKIKLNCKIDEFVLAGIVIRSGDMVIDGSVRGRLKRLASILQS